MPTSLRPMLSMLVVAFSTTPVLCPRLNAQSSSPIGLFIGAEVSSASNFDRSKLTPAIGIDFSFPVVNKIGRLPIHVDFAATAQYTQTATVRDFKSCKRVVDSIVGLPRFGPATGVVCAPPSSSTDTTFTSVFLTDSLTFRTAGAWRGFIQSRTEYRFGGGVGLGLLAGVGLQTNPNSLSSPLQQQIRDVLVEKFRVTLRS